MMRLILLVLAVAFGVDAYFYSGTYTKAAVHQISSQVQALTSNISTNSKSDAPARTGRGTGAT